jgi:hypothetical protein
MMIASIVRYTGTAENGLPVFGSKEFSNASLELLFSYYYFSVPLRLEERERDPVVKKPRGFGASK